MLVLSYGFVDEVEFEHSCPHQFCEETSHHERAALLPRVCDESSVQTRKSVRKLGHGRLFETAWAPHDWV